MRSLYSSTDSRIGFGRDITADSTLAMTSGAGGMRGPTVASAGKGSTLTTLLRHGAIRVSFIGAGVAGLGMDVNAASVGSVSPGGCGIIACTGSHCAEVL